MKKRVSKETIYINIIDGASFDVIINTEILNCTRQNDNEQNSSI